MYNKVPYTAAACIQLLLILTFCSTNRRIDLGYGVSAERLSEERGGQIGIMYGDSLIAPYLYDRIDRPDSILSIIFPYKPYNPYRFDCYGYAILDLKRKEYIYQENPYFPIDTIIAIDRFTYKLYNDLGRHFTTLKLTEISNDGYRYEFIPHFDNSVNPESEPMRINELTTLDNPLYETEYAAWHDMMEVILNYRDFLIVRTDWHEGKREDDELVKSDIFNQRKEQIQRERSILAGNRHSLIHRENLKIIADIDSLILQYRNTNVEGYYHPMWHEVRPAIEQWVASRETITSSQPPDKGEAFRELNKELMDRLYHRIESIDYPELRPDLPENSQ